MAVTHLAPGKIKAIIYFENLRGVVKMLPTDEESLRFRKYMKDLGFEMLAAETLAEARKLQGKLQNQLKLEQENELARDEQVTMYRRQQVRDRLYARMNSLSCNPVEREFIRMWLVVREQKHDLFRRRFTQQIGHLDGLEFDNADKHIHDLLDRV